MSNIFIIGIFLVLIYLSISNNLSLSIHVYILSLSLHFSLLLLYGRQIGRNKSLKRIFKYLISLDDWASESIFDLCKQKKSATHLDVI